MVAHSRAPLRVDRLRALNKPRRVAVELNGHGLPCVVTSTDEHRRAGTSEDEQRRTRTNGDERGRARTSKVEAVGEIWRVDDEWWRKPVSRQYVEVMLEGGKHVTLFEDMTTGEWFKQKP